MLGQPRILRFCFLHVTRGEKDVFGLGTPLNLWEAASLPKQLLALFGDVGMLIAGHIPADLIIQHKRAGGNQRGQPGTRSGRAGARINSHEAHGVAVLDEILQIILTIVVPVVALAVFVSMVVGVV